MSEAPCRRIRPISETAVAIDFGGAASPDVQQKVLAATEFLLQNPFPGMLAVVPTYTSVTVFFDLFLWKKQGQQAAQPSGWAQRDFAFPTRCTIGMSLCSTCFPDTLRYRDVATLHLPSRHAALSGCRFAPFAFPTRCAIGMSLCSICNLPLAPTAARALCLFLEKTLPDVPLGISQPAPLVEIPVRYGGTHGPDLSELAERLQRSESEVIGLHTETEYTVQMVGFLPGFPYLGPLPEALHLPRRDTPRLRVPPGSVAIAGGQTGIYPQASPGGWHLIGHTDFRLFDPHERPPARLQPGQRVRFVAG